MLNNSTPKKQKKKNRYSVPSRANPVPGKIRQVPVITKVVRTLTEYRRVKAYADRHHLKGINAAVKNHILADYRKAPGVERIGYSVKYPYVVVHLRDTNDPIYSEFMVACEEGDMSRDEALDPCLETHDEIAERMKAIRKMHDDTKSARYHFDIFVGANGPKIREIPVAAMGY